MPLSALVLIWVYTNATLLLGWIFSSCLYLQEAASSRHWMFPESIYSATVSVSWGWSLQAYQWSTQPRNVNEIIWATCETPSNDLRLVRVLFVCFFTQVLLYCYKVTVSCTLMVIIAYNHVIKLWLLPYRQGLSIAPHVLFGFITWCNNMWFISGTNPA